MKLAPQFLQAGNTPAHQIFLLLKPVNDLFFAVQLFFLKIAFTVTMHHRFIAVHAQSFGYISLIQIKFRFNKIRAERLYENGS